MWPSEIHLPSTAMVPPCCSASKESLPSSAVTDASPPPLFRSVSNDKSFTEVWREESRSTSSRIPLVRLWKWLQTSSRPPRCASLLVSAGWSCWRQTGMSPSCWLTDWLTGSSSGRARARTCRACLCVVFICVVRSRRAAFSQEPAWAQWAQSAAPGPVINAASGDWKTAGWKGFSSLQHPI